MLLESIIFFLGVSLLFYCLFAGADFGAGIIEAFLSRKHKVHQQEIINKAIGPVWEANHVWLILALVILFVGFPKAYSTLSITFHIPLTIMLVGIILRGCAFTFRHYDVIVDASQKYYTAIFIFSSFLTPFMLGTIAGALLLGRTPDMQNGFAVAFLNPWLNLFSLSVGLFTCVLFAFLAAVYLIGETKDESIRKLFIRNAFIANVAAIVSGIFVFIAAEISNLEIARFFSNHIIGIASVFAATFLLLPLWTVIRKRHLQWARFLAAAQVGFILLGWFGLQAPMIVMSPQGPVSFYNSAAPEPTLRLLLYALLAGSAIIFPSLFYLLKVFKSNLEKE
jgi:cytochrome bd ubiquinol oxidase subunit II